MFGVVAAAVRVVLCAAVTAHASPPRVLYRFADPRITEASGLAVGVRSPGIDWVQNDSGDTNRVFAVDAATGATAGVVTIRGAVNRDWEDLAAAPDPAGRPALWIADTGDNDAVRSQVQLYRVAEPRVSPSGRDRAVTTAPAAVWRLRYPDGPVDTESLAVTPRGVAYLVTKSRIGVSTVYRVPARPDPDRVQTLEAVGTIRLAARASSQAFGLLGTLTATGAALSSDGNLLAVRTYSDAYVWRVRGDDVGAAVRTRPVRVPLPDQPQGEGVAVAGGRLLVDSEGEHAAVDAVALPDLAAAGSSSRAPSLPSPSTPAPRPAAADRSSQWSGWAWVGVGALVLAGAVAVGAVGRRRRAGRRVR